MSNTKHTPGPWEANISYGRIYATANSGRAFCIASEVSEANARLIAAAPELLESLTEMVADLLAHSNLGLSDKETAMLRRAESAIAKATGQQ